MDCKFILTHKKVKDIPEGYTVIDNTENKELDHRLFSEWAGIDLICRAFDKMNEEKVADKTGQTNPNFPPDFVTIAHYRRMPDPDCTKRIYVAQPMVFPCSVAQQYASMHFIEDLKYLGEAIKTLYPNLVQHAEHVLNGNIFIPYNIVTCPYGQFRDWAAFVINVLKKAHELAGNHTFEETVEIIKRRKVPENERRDNRPEYQARWLSMLSERASTIYWLQCAKQVPVFPMKINLMEKGQKI